MDLQQLNQVKSDAQLIYTPEQLQSAIQQLAASINQHHSQDTPHLITLMNGGLVFAGQLAPLLDFPMTMGYVHATRYRNQLHGSGIEWKVAADDQIKGRVLLLVDDIYDEGATLVEVKERLLEQGAKAVYTIVLLDKQHDRKIYPDYTPDYVGLPCPDQYVFGYGLDYKGYWRNANGIFAI